MPRTSRTPRPNPFHAGLAAAFACLLLAASPAAAQRFYGTVSVGITDYPAGMQPDGRRRSARLRFELGRNGAVVRCTIVRPSGEDALDRSACLILQERAAAAAHLRSRWLQLPLYLGLIVAQCVYVFLFVKELVHLVSHAMSFTEQQIMLVVLGLIDVVMISNLLIMVIVGGYETFVSRMGLEAPSRPARMALHVNASVLKVKLAMAIIGISSIHLLKTFILRSAGSARRPCRPGRHCPRWRAWRSPARCR
jgi:uncharacterized protein (TIGR00645 family)